MTGRSTAQLDPARLPNRLDRGIYVCPSEMDAVSPPLPCSHSVRRLFKDLGLDGVLYVGRMPRAVFKRVKQFFPADVRAWQKAVWNHAVTPLLVLLSDTEVRVYSGQSLPAREDQDPDTDRRLVDTFESVADILQFDNAITTIESGELFRDRQAHFDRDNAVDGYLLKNIEAAATRLCESGDPSRHLSLEEAHEFLLRLLFACYLIDREMISGGHFPETSALRRLGREHGLLGVLEGLEATERRDTLCRLFRRIGVLFNGSVFDPDDLEKEEGLLCDQHIDVVMQFLRGDDLGTGQLALGFWAYDFRYIPIEAVSAIYERFLGSGGPGVREETGAYYTPPHLVELVVDIALEKMPTELLDCTVLDPACGSGVFLVAAFNRMAEQWRRENPGRRNLGRARELQRILKTRLFGIDSNETACHIACFSLYLAYLDQLSPRDVEELQGNGVTLPKLLLRKGDAQPADEPRTIINRNFFEPDRQLPRDKFDVIVGNPPWVSRGQVRDPEFLAWVERTEKPVPQKQMACGFMWEARELLAEAGRACLLVPSAILLGQNADFHRAWFRAVSVDRMVDFSDLRKLLFPGAKHPCVAVRYRAVPPANGATLSYEVPKTDIVSQQRGPVVLYDEDVSIVSLAEVLCEAEDQKAPLVWKTRLWGTPRDRRFLQHLADIPALEKLAGEPQAGKRWIKGRGLQARFAGSDENPAWWTHSTPFLDTTGGISFLPSPEDCTSVGNRFDVVHRLPYKEACTPPFVLASQGARPIKVAFVDFTAVFRHSLYVISGPKEDEDLLRFLAAVLKSKLAEYFLFHTSASLGTERDKTHLFELLRLPFPLPEQCEGSARAREIVLEVSHQIAELGHRIRGGKLGLGREEAIRALKSRLEPLIFEYYDVDDSEAMLIEDTLRVSKPSSTPGSPRNVVPALRRPTRDEQSRYAKTLCTALRSHAVPRFKGYINGTITWPPDASVALVTLSKGPKAQDPKEVHDARRLNRSLRRLAGQLPSRRRSLACMRNLKVIEKGRIHITKPLILRSWTRTAALNDADEILGAVLMKKARN